MKNEVIELYGGRQLELTGDNNVDLWLKVYRGESHWIGGYNMKSLNLGAEIPSELAKTATIEFESEVDNESIDQDYQFAVKNLRRATEYGLALGGFILKPYPVDDRVAIEILTPDQFIPLDVGSFGGISRVVFIDTIIQIENKEAVYYTKIEEHDRTGKEYLIKNKCFRSTTKGKLGKEIALNNVDAWADIAAEAVLKADYNLFGYFKNPQANNLDLKSPMGISCFARALSLIQDADEQYNRILWEYEAKEVAIDADVTMLINDELPSGKERLFRKLNVGTDDFYSVFSPEIRDSSLFNGLNNILKRVEDLCQLSRGTLSYVENLDKTATEVKASNQRLYAAVVDIQKNLEECLEDTVKAIAFWLNVKDKYHISFDWDDSVIVDTGTEQAIRLQEVAAGILKPEKYLEWRYGIDEEEASEYMPDVVLEEDTKQGAYDEERYSNLTDGEDFVFNGSQIASLIRVIESMYKKTITYETAVKIIMNAFQFTEDRAKDLLGPKPTDDEIEDAKITGGTTIK